MIAIDWGTNSARAYRLGSGETASAFVLDRRESASGILRVPPGGFADGLRAMVGDWLDAGETQVLLSGMVGSRQGWIEAPYLPCPAGLDDLASALVAVPFEGATVRLVPGLRTKDRSGVPEVMRGEEMQCLGAATGSEALLCLPGSHAKWVRIGGGRITGFETSMTGEAYAALRDHTILGRMMEGDAQPGAAFDQGVGRAAQPGGILHHLFGTRALALFDRLTPADAASYLSGLLIGHEVASSLPFGAHVHIVGTPSLAVLYARAIEQSGGGATVGDADAAARGLALIGRRAAWTR